MQDATVLILPGWLGSGPEHWQMHWVRQHGYTLVEQNDWKRPRRGDWLARLDEVVIDTPGPVVLVAHRLGCILVAAWAAFSRHTARVQGALLMAPADVESHNMKNSLPGWTPIVRQVLPFASIVVGRQNDPDCTVERAQQLASDWGARWVDPEQVGHNDAESALGDWPQGRSLLETFLKD
jgi:predicted alpha/beta hydrolase family esterase